jgi:hypothetical protein
MHVGNESGRRWANEDACNKVTDECGHLDPFGNEPEDQSDAEASGNGRNQRDIVVHSVSFVWPRDANVQRNSLFGWIGFRYEKIACKDELSLYLKLSDEVIPKNRMGRKAILRKVRRRSKSLLSLGPVESPEFRGFRKWPMVDLKLPAARGGLTGGLWPDAAAPANNSNGRSGGRPDQPLDARMFWQSSGSSIVACCGDRRVTPAMA